MLKYLEEKHIAIVADVELANDTVDATPQALTLKAWGPTSSFSAGQPRAAGFA